MKLFLNWVCRIKGSFVTENAISSSSFDAHYAAKAVVQPCWHSPHKGSDLEYKTLGAGYSAQRLKQVFGIDIKTYRACGGAVRIIAYRRSGGDR